MFQFCCTHCGLRFGGVSDLVSEAVEDIFVVDRSARATGDGIQGEVSVPLGVAFGKSPSCWLTTTPSSPSSSPSPSSSTPGISPLPSSSSSCLSPSTHISPSFDSFLAPIPPNYTTLRRCDIVCLSECLQLNLAPFNCSPAANGALVFTHSRQVRCASCDEVVGSRDTPYSGYVPEVDTERCHRREDEWAFWAKVNAECRNSEGSADERTVKKALMIRPPMSHAKPLHRPTARVLLNVGSVAVECGGSCGKALCPSHLRATRAIANSGSHSPVLTHLLLSRGPLSDVKAQLAIGASVDGLLRYAISMTPAGMSDAEEWLAAVVALLLDNGGDIDAVLLEDFITPSGQCYKYRRVIERLKAECGECPERFDTPKSGAVTRPTVPVHAGSPCCH